MGSCNIWGYKYISGGGYNDANNTLGGVGYNEANNTLGVLRYNELINTVGGVGYIEDINSGRVPVSGQSSCKQDHIMCENYFYISCKSDITSCVGINNTCHQTWKQAH